MVFPEKDPDGPSADITNTGNTTGTQAVTLRIRNETTTIFEDGQSVTLEAGEVSGVVFGRSGELANAAAGGSVGTCDAIISTKDDSVTVQTILASIDGSTLEVRDIDAPDTEQGETANVTAEVDEVGGLGGTANVTLSIEGTDIEQTREVTFSQQQLLPLASLVDTSGLSPGTHNVTVTTNAHEATTTLNVTS